MSKEFMIDGLPREVAEWLHTAVDADTGRTSLLAYALARLVGLDPRQSVASAVLFEMDAVRTWSSADTPTRGELFATAERTVLRPPASFLRERRRTSFDPAESEQQHDRTGNVIRLPHVSERAVRHSGNGGTAPQSPLGTSALPAPSGARPDAAAGPAASLHGD